MTCSQAGAIIGCSNSHVASLIKTGKIAADKIPAVGVPCGYVFNITTPEARLREMSTTMIKRTLKTPIGRDAILARINESDFWSPSDLAKLLNRPAPSIYSWTTTNVLTKIRTNRGVVLAKVDAAECAKHFTRKEEAPAQRAHVNGTSSIPWALVLGGMQEQLNRLEDKLDRLLGIWQAE